MFGVQGFVGFRVGGLGMTARSINPAWRVGGHTK